MFVCVVCCCSAAAVGVQSHVYHVTTNKCTLLYRAVPQLIRVEMAVDVAISTRISRITVIVILNEVW